MTPREQDPKFLNVQPASANPIFRPASPVLREEDFVGALMSVGAVADSSMVRRAQRRVREQALEMADRRRRARHAIGLAILGFSLLLLVLTPVIWGGFHFEEGWQHFTDSETQFMVVIAWLFPVTLAGLLLALLRVRGDRGTRRIDHRLDSRLDSMVR
jgi:fatty acid desaturase